VNVVICDDHRLFSDALASVLEAHGWTIVSCAADPAHAVAAIAQTHVDACLMDLSFPEGDIGLEGIVSVHEASPDTKVVVLTATSDPRLIMRAVQSGADAIVFKDDDIDHILDVVERTERHSAARASIAPSGTESGHNTSATDQREAEDLVRFPTKREREILDRMVRGESGRHLVRQFDISYAAARSHLQSVLAKLGVRSRLEAVALAVEHGLHKPARDKDAQ
jgi:DNA-binding NarL/FixJ family response regulator